MVVLLEAIDAWFDGEAIDPYGYPSPAAKPSPPKHVLGGMPSFKVTGPPSGRSYKMRIWREITPVHTNAMAKRGPLVP
jgi:hypothetical protein